LLAGDDHVRLEDHALEVDAVLEELVEHRLERNVGHFLAAVDGVGAVHQHFRLHDGDDIVLLAERGVARERVGVGFDAERSRDGLGDVDHRAPLREPRSERAVFDEPLAQAVEPLGDGLAGEARQRLRAEVDFDARDDAVLRQVLRERSAIARLLPDRLVVEDHTADRLFRARGGEEQLAVTAAVLLGGVQPDGVEALLDGAAALVRGQNPLALGNHRLGDAGKLIAVHLYLSSSNGAASCGHVDRAAGPPPGRSREWKGEGYQIAPPRKAADDAPPEGGTSQRWASAWFEAQSVLKWSYFDGSLLPGTTLWSVSADSQITPLSCSRCWPSSRRACKPQRRWRSRPASRHRR